MKKSFTLIELLVTIAIIVIMIAASAPAFSMQKSRANLDAAVKQVRDLVNQTQNYALAPEKSTSSDYLLIMNFGNSPVPVNPGSASCPGTTPGVASMTYGIYSIAETNPPHASNIISPCARVLIKSGNLQATATINYSSPGQKDLKIHFRTSDGLAGFDGAYDGGKFSDPNYVVITITQKTFSKIVRINKFTGETEIQ